MGRPAAPADRSFYGGQVEKYRNMHGFQLASQKLSTYMDPWNGFVNGQELYKIL